MTYVAVVAAGLGRVCAFVLLHSDTQTLKRTNTYLI